MPRTSQVQSALLRSTIGTHDLAVDRVSEIVDGLSSVQANWRPAAKAWSVAECIEHLNQTLGTYMERLSPAIAEARSRGKAGGEPYGRGTLAGRFLVNFLRQPSKKVSAPRVYQPTTSELEIIKVAATFRESCSQLVELAEQADGLALGSIRIATPVSRWIRLSVAQAFEVQDLHTPRHLAQAERVKQHESFPKS